MLTDMVPDGETVVVEAAAAPENPDLLQDAVDSLFG
jgi:hypothetical protein